MKKIILYGLSIISLFASDKILNQIEIDNILKVTPFYNKLKSNLDNKKIKIKAVQKEKFYIIEIISMRKKALFYITRDKKYTILGKVLKNNNGQLLTPNFSKNVNIIKKGIMFSFGKGKNIYLVTDPECSFCRYIEKKNLLNNYRVNVILLSPKFHKYSKLMNYYILAGKTDKDKVIRMRQVFLGNNIWKNFHPTKQEINKYEKKLKKAKQAADELEVDAIPSIYDDKFNRIPWSKL